MKRLSVKVIAVFMVVMVFFSALLTLTSYASSFDGNSNGAEYNERDIVLVLDVSGSMAGNPLEETKKASTKFVNTILNADTRAGIVVYGNHADRLSDFSNNNSALTDLISNINTGGLTNIEEGLTEARAMLDQSNAKKKIIVLMSDGEPNVGKIGNELIDYADELKNEGIIIYTLGFFEGLGSYKHSAQLLMEEIARDGCHYEVADADDLVFFFGDVADQINGQKYIYVRIACPVDVTVTYKGETLSSAEDNFNVRTDFGTLTFEDNENSAGFGKTDQIKVLRLKEGADYDVRIVGTGDGTMDYTIGFMDENGDYSDFRQFENIDITSTTIIDTVATVSEESVLKIDKDGDGKIDEIWTASANSKGKIKAEEPENESNTLIIVLICILAVLLVAGIVVIIVVACKKSGTKEAVDTSIVGGAVISRAYVDVGHNVVRRDYSIGSLKVLSGPMKGFFAQLHDGKTYYLGKDPKRCHIVLSHDYIKVSRVHCSITYDSKINSYYIVDISSNGTYFVNRERMIKGRRILLRPGTTVLLAGDECAIALG